jgi:hypothetical protein
MEKNTILPTKKVLLKDLGATLPIIDKKKSNNTFSFLDWGFEEEKKIARLKEKKPSIGKFVSEVLCLMLKSFCGEDFSSKDEKAKLLVLNQQPIGNILYMYLFLRYDQLGSSLKMNFQCGRCGHKIPEYIADVGHIDVNCKQGDYSDTTSVKLLKPITLDKGDQLIEEVTMTLAKWDVMEHVDGLSSRDEGSIKEHTFRNSIVGAKGVQGIFQPDDIIKKLKKIDIERLTKALTDHNGGPEIKADVECDRCKFQFEQQIDWSFDSFFGIGSLPAQ